MITPITSIADHSIDERVLVLLDEEIAPLIAFNSAVGADGIAAFDGNLRVRLHFRIQVVKSLSITKLATERDQYLSRRLKEVSSSQDLDNVITDILTQTENLPVPTISAPVSRVAAITRPFHREQPTRHIPSYPSNAYCQHCRRSGHDLKECRKLQRLLNAPSDSTTAPPKKGRPSDRSWTLNNTTVDQRHESSNRCDH
jgi:hypothetical protein